MKNKSKISFKRSIIQIDICLIVVIAVFIGLYFMLSSNASKNIIMPFNYTVILVGFMIILKKLILVLKVIYILKMLMILKNINNR